MLGVDPSTVANWCKQDLLPSTRTKGGHLRIQRTDLVEFADAQGLPLDQGGFKREVLSTHQAGELIGTDPTTIIFWCDTQGLAFHRTPGGHRRIRHDDLMAFLEEHGSPALGRPAPVPILCVQPSARRRPRIERLLADLKNPLSFHHDLLSVFLEHSANRQSVLVLEQSAETQAFLRKLDGLSSHRLAVVVIAESASAGQVRSLEAAGVSVCTDLRTLMGTVSAALGGRS